MTHITAIINQKGGVAKTTTALALADTLRASGRRVLLIDLDQQHNPTRQYGASTEGQVTTYDLLCTEGLSNDDYESAVQRCAQGDVVAGDPELANAEVALSKLTCREARLADALEHYLDHYDEILIDCAPSLGAVSINALVAATSVIVPIVVDRYSLEGLTRLIQLCRRIQTSKRLNPALRLEGLLVCQYVPTERLTKSFEESIPEIAEYLGVKVFETSIRRCVKVKEAQQASRSLFDYAPVCTAAKDYKDFCGEYLLKREL